MLLFGCVQSASVVCPDGTLCRVGTECVAVLDGYACAGDEAVCGNGRVEGTEVCDDGNNQLGDGCSADCGSSETCGNDLVDPVRRVGDMFVPNEQCDDGGFLGHDGCSSSCAPETPRTIEIAKLPERRVGAAMVTDTTLRRIVMFGGRIGESVGRTSNETWELDEDGWIQLRVAVSPPPRTGHALAYDGSQIVLFGGGDTNQTFGDTWTLQGVAWTLVSTPTAPGPRVNHAMAYLPGTGVVLFGGDNKGQPLGDTWVFAQGAWTMVASGPPARSQHTLTHDPIRGVLVLTAGTVGLGGERVVDTWEFDGATWMYKAGSGVPDIVAATATFDRTKGHVLLDGGYNTVGIFGGPPTSPLTYAWDGQAWSTVSETGPAFAQHASAADPVTGEMVQFGGIRPPSGGTMCQECPTIFDETHRLRGASWTRRPFVNLVEMRGAAATNDPLRRRAVLFSPTGTTFELGNGSWMQSEALGPSARTGAAMAFGRYDGEPVAILFGGVMGAAMRDDVMWTWDGAAWTQRTPSSLPLRRRGHTMVYDARNDRTLLVGGTDGADYNDTWAWNGTAWEALGGDRITARFEHAMAYDPIREVVVLFGGIHMGNALGDLWQLDDSGWTRLEPPFGPSPRYGASMAWDAARQRVVLFGGTPASDTWEWDGTAWTFVNGDVAEPRSQFPMVSAPGGAGVLAIGGALDGLDQSDATLHLVTSTGFAGYATCRSGEDDDGDSRAGCEEPDCWATCAPMCPPGAACDADARRCGDGECDAPRERCGICADCPCP
jgi:cysteine-rich repeat protein